MLYELFAVARTHTHIAEAAVNNDAKAVALTIGKLVIGNRGVVRRIISLGPRYLPKFVKKDQEVHFQGSYFTMLFDASPSAQNELLRILRSDPRVLRSAIFKVPTNKQLNAKCSLDEVNEVSLR